MSSKSSVHFYVDDKIDFNKRRIFLDSEITRSVVGRLIRSLQLMNDTDVDLPIEFFINSEGGDVEAGLALIDMMSLVEAPIHTIAIGEVSSMALMIFMMGDERSATKNVKFLHHQSSAAPEGRVKELKKDLKEIEELEEICTEILVEKTRKGKKFWDKSIENGDFIFNAKDALKYGVVHKILP